MAYAYPVQQGLSSQYAEELAHLALDAQLRLPFVGSLSQWTVDVLMISCIRMIQRASNMTPLEYWRVLVT